LNANDLLLWTDDLSVRTQEVDAQHKGLFDLINRLHVVIRENHGSEPTREILDQLAESIQDHFLFEESLMRLTHYAGYAAHKDQHEALMEKLRTLQDSLDNGSITMTVDLMHFHKTWWNEHIRNSDRHFSIHYENSELVHGTKTDRDSERSEWSAQEKHWWKFW
jgi:hemerythrin